jgi:SAM-dependent methyltransferase
MTRGRLGVLRPHPSWAERWKWLRYRAIDAWHGPPAWVTCPVCEVRARAAGLRRHIARCIFGGGPILRHECADCGAIFGSSRMLSMSDEELAREYDALYAWYDEGDTTAYERFAFDILEPRRDAVYLNYGSGRWSRAADELRAAGYVVFGYEPYSRRPDAFTLNDPAALERMRFDGIMTHNVLEHLPDPVGVTRGLASLLRSGGRLVHSTACFRYTIEYSRFHVCFFTGRATDVLAERAGLLRVGREVSFRDCYANCFVSAGRSDRQVSAAARSST